MKSALRSILAISVFGLLFSGYLSYVELYAHPTGPSCPSPGPAGTVFGYPACIYGFFMYAAIVVVSGLGLLGRRPSVPIGRTAEST